MRSHLGEPARLAGPAHFHMNSTLVTKPLISGIFFFCQKNNNNNNSNKKKEKKEKIKQNKQAKNEK